MLGNGLHRYSGKIMKSLARQSMIATTNTIMDADLAAQFTASAFSQIDSKPFYHESDRKVAKGIIETFLARRLLADSVRRKDVVEVRRLLGNLREPGHRQVTLGASVDYNGNTLLHLAVIWTSDDMVNELLAQG